MAEGGALNYLNESPVFTFGNTLRTIDQKKKEQLYQQQYSQKLYQQNAAMLQKQMEGIRSADVPEVMTNYQRYSNAQKYLLANPNLVKKNPQEYARVKQEADEAYSSIFQLSNQSKEQAKTDAMINEDGFKNWQRYDDNVHAMIADKNNIPTSQILANGLNDPQHYLYQGTNRNFNKDFKDVVGKDNQFEENLGLSDDGINDKIQKWKIHNTPLEILQGIAGIAGERTAQKDYQRYYDHAKQTGDYEAVREAYENMVQDPNAKRLWIKNDYNLIPDEVKDTPLGYAAMKASLMAAPENLGASTKVNEKAKMELADKQRKALAALNHNYRMTEAAYREGLSEKLADFKKAKDEGEQDNITDLFINSQFEDAKSNATIGDQFYDGGYVLRNSPTLNKEFSKGSYAEDQVRNIVMTPDKQSVKIIYEGGKSDIMPMSDYRVTVKKWLGKATLKDLGLDKTAQPKPEKKQNSWDKYKR